jgi:hypothetical protein
MVWELHEHDVDQVMREVRDAVRYWEEHPEEAEAVVRIGLNSGRLDTLRLPGSSALRAASSRALAAAQTDFGSIVTRHHGWRGRLERAYKRVVRKSTGWLFFQQSHANRALAMALVEVAHEVARLSNRIADLEKRLGQAGEPVRPASGEEREGGTSSPPQV